MGLILRAACVRLCQCEQHGCIIFGDGSKTPEFYTREDALGEISDALVANKITHAEEEFLRGIIRESKIMSKEEMEGLKHALSGIGHSLDLASEPEPVPDLAHRRDLH